jgi:N-acetylglutamate synthase-like GNAT family acetyltransferase
VTEQEMNEFSNSVRFIKGVLDDGVPEIAYLVGKPRELSREILTHEGAGLLFSKVSRSHIQQVELRDISDITFQIYPQIKAGYILPVTGNEIAQNIRNFWVCKIDNQIVSLLRLKEYGDWAEIAPGSTIFRDRKYGRLSELFAYVLGEARQRGIKVIFGVGISAKKGIGTFPNDL